MERMEWKWDNFEINGEERFAWKDRWPVGPWDDEPDKVQWPDESTGLPCLAVRNRMGAWCGYVGLPPGHPFREMEYDDIPVEVHGGLTFGPAECMEDERLVCHVTHDPEEEDVRWIGFDCLHIGDTAPGMMASEAYLNSKQREEGKPEFHLYDEGDKGAFLTVTYKPLAYVTEEVTNLARQVAAAR